MRKMMLVVSLLGMICSQASLDQARSASEQSPLLVSVVTNEEPHEFALYQYIDATWQRLSLDGFYAASMSPDGERVAYLRVPPFLQALIEDGQGWLYGSAWDITLVELATVNPLDVAIQPTTITINPNGYSGGIKRSLPVWSPDGSALAWTEQDYPAAKSIRLVIYDIASATSRVLDDTIPPMNLSADGLPSLLSWGLPAIAVFTNDPSNSAETLRLYNPTDASLEVVRFEDDLEWSPLTGLFWVAGDSEAVVLQSNDYLWYAVDPTTLEITSLETQLEMVNAARPDESLRLVWDIYADAKTPAWRFLTTDGTELLAVEDIIDASGVIQFVISPSGQSAAYLQDGKLYLWQDGVVAEVDPPPGMQLTALYWGQVYWQPGAENEDGIG